MFDHDTQIGMLIGIFVISLFIALVANKIRNVVRSKIPTAKPMVRSLWTIKTTDGNIHSVTYAGLPSFGANKATRKFAKWYFGRSGDFFVIKYENKGFTVLERKKIVSIEIQPYEEKAK